MKDFEEFFYNQILKENISLYCVFNLVVGRKILWYFKLKILRGL
jgi:hypothetical protein